MKLIRSILLSAAILLLASSFVLGASFGDKLRALWGSRMTVEQLWSVLDPTELAGMSATMRATNVTWGPTHTSVVRVSLMQMSLAAGLGEAGSILSTSIPSITVAFKNDGVQFSGFVAGYGASNTVTDPYHYRVPYMWVMARLLWDGATLDQLANDGYNVWKITTGGLFELWGPGDYQNVSYHYVEFPAGHDPATLYEIKASRVYRLYW